MRTKLHLNWERQVEKLPAATWVGWRLIAYVALPLVLVFPLGIHRMLLRRGDWFVYPACFLFYFFGAHIYRNALGQLPWSVSLILAMPLLGVAIFDAATMWRRPTCKTES